MKTSALSLLIIYSLACQRDDSRDNRAVKPEALVDAPPPAAASPADPTPAPQPVPRVEQRYERQAGWSSVSIRDSLPFCVFSSSAEHAAASFIGQVGKQTLRPDSRLTLGIFPNWCVNEACDQIPSLQCSVEREGKTLVLRSHYWGDRKDGSKCEGMTCRPIGAACETPALETGIHTIVYGDRRFELRIPSVLRSPCFGLEPSKRPKT